jgi:hypothetical protein
VNPLLLIPENDFKYKVFLLLIVLSKNSKLYEIDFFIKSECNKLLLYELALVYLILLLNAVTTSAFLIIVLKYIFLKSHNLDSSKLFISWALLKFKFLEWYNVGTIFWVLAFLAILEEAQTLALDKLERVVLVPTIFLYSVKKLVCRMNLSDTRRFFVNHLVENLQQCKAPAFLSISSPSPAFLS